MSLIREYTCQAEYKKETHLSDAIRKIWIPSDKCSVDISDLGVYFSILVQKENIKRETIFIWFLNCLKTIVQKRNYKIIDGVI